MGGIANYIFELVRHLPARRLRVIALPSLGAEQFDSKQQFTIDRIGMPIAASASSPLFKFLAPIYFFYLLKSNENDILLCDCAHHSLMLPVWCLSKIRRVTFGVFSHGTDLLRHQGKFYTKVYNKLLRSANYLFSNSQKTAEILLCLGVAKKKIRIIHPPVNTSKLRTRVCKRHILNCYNLHGKRIILTVGRLIERKGIDRVIAALPLVLKAVPNAHYMVVGIGPYEEHLRSMVNDLGLQSSVTFAGFVEDDQLGAYYGVSDLFVMVSREFNGNRDIEGFGIVFLEANWFGIPVVAGKGGGTADAVIHGITGLHVNPNSTEEVAGSIIQLLKNDRLATQLGQIGKERVVREFSGSVAARKVLAAIS